MGGYCRSALAMLARRGDESRRGRIQIRRRAVSIGDDWRELVGEFLAERHPSLFEGITVPNGRLREYLR